MAKEGRTVWKSFRMRIFAAMLVVALVSVSLLYGVSYRNAVGMLERNYLRVSAENVSGQIARFDESMAELYRGAVRAGADEGLRAAVLEYRSLPQPHAEDVMELSEVLDGLRSDAIEMVYLYLPETREIITSDELRQRQTGINADAYPWTRPTEGFSPIRFIDTMRSSAARTMYGYSKRVVSETGETLAVACVGTGNQTLRYLLGTDGIGYLCSGVGVTALRQGTPALSSLLPDAAALLERGGMVYGTSGDWLYASAQADFSGVQLLRLTARDSLRDDLADVRWQYLLLMLMVCALALMLSQVLEHWLYAPMNTLMRAMEKVGGGDLSPSPAPAQPEEFRQLGEHFNRMIGEINSLIDDLVAERTAKAEAELRALQYQIQPHFMYNTLNSIKYAAILQGNPKIGEQLGAFIELLEASISKKGALLPLSEELQLLESYASLQRYRYMDCFTIDYDATEASRGCYVPRLLLQPIVENAILHGMDVKRNDNVIRVAALVSDGDLWITVQDNGAGMSPEQMQALLYGKTDDHRRFTGIGVANVRERLALYYGERSSLRVYSRVGGGTKFVLCLPASYDEEEYSR